MFNSIHNILYGNGKHMCAILESEIDVLNQDIKHIIIYSEK